jgi:hypothetical protein
VQQLLNGLRLLQQQVGQALPAATGDSHSQRNGSNPSTQTSLHGNEHVPPMQASVKPSNVASTGTDRASTDQHANRPQADQHEPWLQQVTHDRHNDGQNKSDDIDGLRVLKSVALLQAYHAQQHQSQDK